MRLVGVATVTMLFGEIGSGKTTCARQLESTGVVRFSLDEWVIAATGDTVHVDDSLVERMLDQLMRCWPQVVRCGCSVVLDFAFWQRSRRDQVRAVAEELGVDVDLVALVCDPDVRRARVLRRTQVDPGAFVIDDGGFDWITRHRQIDPIGDDEPHRTLDTTTGT